MKKQTQPTFDIDFRKEYPTLKENHNGVDVVLTAEQYEKTIAAWEANQAKEKDEAKARQEIVAAREAEAEAKATAKAALLTQLGITAEQAKLLLS
jgi:predicted cobalt transporter CbtA